MSVLSGNTNSGSAKLMRAFVAVLIVLLFASGIAMVTEKDAGQQNKMWFGVAYITFAGLLGIFYVFMNIMT